MAELTHKEMSEQLQRAIGRLTELRGVEVLTDEQNAEVDTNIRAVNELTPMLQGALAVEMSRQSAGSVARASRGGHAIAEDQDTRTVGEKFNERLREVFSNERSMGTNGSVSMEIPAEELKNTRALVTVAGLPGSYLEPMRLPGIQRYDTPFQSLRDVLLVGQTDADSIYYVQEASYTNNAAAVGEATATTGSSGLKPESAFTLAQVTAPVATIAHWIPVTKQTLWNAPELRSYIENRLIDGLRYAEDAQLLNGNGTPPNLTGLLNTSGVLALNEAYFDANPTKNVGTAAEPFDRVRRARTRIAVAGRAQANFVVLNPVDRENYDLTVDGENRYYGGGPMAPGNVTGLWGLRVVENEGITAGTALVGDGRQAQIFDRMSARVEAGWVGDDFIRNIVRLLAESRLGLAVFRPSAFAIVDITPTP